MLSVSMIEAPSRIGRTGRSARQSFMVAPIDYTDRCSYLGSRREPVKHNCTDRCYHEQMARQGRNRGANPGDRRPAVLPAGHPRDRRGHGCRRDRHQQAHPLQSLPVQGRADRRLPVTPPGRARDHPTGRRSSRSWARSIGSSSRSRPGAFAAAPSSTPWPSSARRSTEINRLAVAFKERRRLWFGELLARLAGADANGLATQLALLLDGAIAASLVRGDPAFVRAAREAAVTLIEAASQKKRKRRR